MNDTAARPQPELSPLEQLCIEHALPCVDLAAFSPQPEALRLVHHTIARKLQVLPLSRVGPVLTIILSEPNLCTVDSLRFATGLFVETVLAPAGEIDAAIARFYGLDEPQIEVEGERLEVEISYLLRTEQTANALISAAMNSPRISKHVSLRANVHRAFYVGSIDAPTDFTAAIEAALKAVGK
jgi:hypothetical protein